MTDIKSFRFDSFSFGFRFDAKGFHSRPKVKIPKVKSKLKAGETTNQSFEKLYQNPSPRCSLNQEEVEGPTQWNSAVEWEPFFEFFWHVVFVMLLLYIKFKCYSQFPKLVIDTHTKCKKSIHSNTRSKWWMEHGKSSEWVSAKMPYSRTINRVSDTFFVSVICVCCECHFGFHFTHDALMTIIIFCMRRQFSLPFAGCIFSAAQRGVHFCVFSDPRLCMWKEQNLIRWSDKSLTVQSHIKTHTHSMPNRRRARNKSKMQFFGGNNWCGTSPALCSERAAACQLFIIWWLTCRLLTFPLLLID